MMEHNPYAPTVGALKARVVESGEHAEIASRGRRLANLLIDLN